MLALSLLISVKGLKIIDGTIVLANSTCSLDHLFWPPPLPFPHIYWYTVNVKILCWPVKIQFESSSDQCKNIPSNLSASAVSYLYHSFLYRAAHRPRLLVGPILFSELCRPAITSDKAFKLLSWKYEKKPFATFLFSKKLSKLFFYQIIHDIK